MVRDFKQRTGVWSRTRDRCGVLSKSSGTYVKSESARDDSSNSDGSRPTGYWAYRRSVELIPFSNNSPSISRWCGTSPNRILKFDHWTGTRFITGKLQLSSTNRPIVPQNVINHSVNNALLNASEQKVDLGESLAEAVANAGELSELAIRIGKSLLAFKRGQFAAAFRHLGGGKPKGKSPGAVTANSLADAAASTFLAYKFALKPAFDTAMNLHGAINDRLAKDNHIVSTGTYVEDPGMKATLTYLASGQLLRGAQTGLTFNMSNQWLAGLQSVGLLNPAFIAWNLVPLSFLIDWFIQVGDFLNTVSATAGLDFVHGYTTKFVKTRANVTGYNSEFGLHQNKVTEFGMSRSLAFPPSLPRLTYSLKPINLNQKAVLASLLQLLR